MCTLLEASVADNPQENSHLEVSGFICLNDLRGIRKLHSETTVEESLVSSEN